MNTQLFRKILLVDIGNLTIQKDDIQLNDVNQNILSNEVKYAINFDGKPKLFDNYELWLDYLIEVEKVQSFRIFFLDGKYIYFDIAKFEKKDILDSVFIECIKEKSSDFYTELTLTNTSTERCIFPIYTDIPINYKIKEDISILKIEIGKLLKKLYDFVEDRKVYYLVPFFLKMQKELEQHFFTNFSIPDNNFSIEQKQIINTFFINSTGIGNIMMWNETILNENEEKELFNLYHQYNILLDKAFLKSLNKISDDKS